MASGTCMVVHVWVARETQPSILTLLPGCSFLLETVKRTVPHRSGRVRSVLALLLLIRAWGVAGADIARLQAVFQGGLTLLGRAVRP